MAFRKDKKAAHAAPIVPKELITPALVKLIISGWKDGCKELPNAFNELEKTILATYVGKPVDGSTTTRPPIYPASLWCVCGLASRTNNAAESVHRNLNSKISGKLAIFKFLCIIEEEMERTNDRIVNGCRPETRAVELVKNQRLAVELELLINGKQGVICFLENCGMIIRTKSVGEANKVNRSIVSTVDDIEWMLANRTSLVTAACDLHGRLCPGSDVGNEFVLDNVKRWAFQLPPEPGALIGPSRTRLSLMDRSRSQRYNELKNQFVQKGIACPSEQAHQMAVQNVQERTIPTQQLIFVPIPVMPRFFPRVQFPMLRWWPRMRYVQRDVNTDCN